MVHARRSARRVVALLVLAGVLSGCGTSSTPATPALAQWPPVPSRGVAAGIGLVVNDDGKTVTVSNASSTTYWIQPNVAPVWYGGAPWVTSSEWPSTGVALDPGAALQLPLGSFPSAPARVGVLLWASASPDIARDQPWFVWKDLPAGQG